MPRRGEHLKKDLFAGGREPDGFAVLGAAFFEWMRVRGYSERTVENRQMYLGYFVRWCEERGVSSPKEVSRPMIDRYQRHLFHHRKPNGEPLSFRGQHTRLLPVRAFFRWLAKTNQILYNPAADMELPKIERRLPRFVLSASEAEAVINGTDADDPIGVRDRAILEVLYSTGMRRMEIIQLDLYAVDAERGTVMIRQGKGKKDRMVPIGERAIAWVTKYAQEVRPKLVCEPDPNVLFLTSQGESFTANRMTQLVRDYVDKAGINKRGSCHLFRHTMATLMLEGGADIRFIQAMLGHVDLSTTQIYTQVSIRKLKEIHSATHPARATRSKSSTPIKEESPSIEDLYSSLEAEAEEEV